MLRTAIAVSAALKRLPDAQDFSPKQPLLQRRITCRTLCVLEAGQLRVLRHNATGDEAFSLGTEFLRRNHVPERQLTKLKTILELLNEKSNQ